MPDSRLAYLFSKYYHKTATEEERAEFIAITAQLKSEDALLKLMEKAHQDEYLNTTDTVFAPQISEKILAQIFAAQNTDIVETKVRKFNYKWIGYAAAILIVFLSVGVYFFRDGQRNNQRELYANNVAPGGNKAVLTLGNGKKIILDDAQNGMLAKQGNISISKAADGQLVYTVEDGGGSAKLNTIETPEGGQYQVNLPDGTKVWLNAGTRLTFPTKFVDKQRIVELSGEAYFEVAKDTKKPFKVKMSNNTEVQVLGTHFNVSAYNEENSIKTTLLEGAVALRANEKTQRISPGQQATLSRGDNNISVANDVNLDEVVAWKNGFFSVESITLQDLMKKVEKWYGVKVVYKESVQADFVAALPRNISLAELLDLLQLTKKVQFKLENKTLTIMK